MQEGALPIVLEGGEVRTGVNLDLEYVALATISGSVVVPPGVQTTVLPTDMARSAQIRVQGRGRYQLTFMLPMQLAVIPQYITMINLMSRRLSRPADSALHRESP